MSLSSPPALSFTPIAAVLKWQIALTVLCASGAWFVAGGHGGISAALGGVVNATSVVLYWFVANLGLAKSRASAGSSGLWPLLRAEIVKVVFVLVQVGFLFKTYAQLHMPSFFVTFLVTLLAWRVALSALARSESST